MVEWPQRAFHCGGFKHDQFTQSLKAQWLSGIKPRLNEVWYKLDKFNQVIARYLIAQWLSGLKLRLNDVRHRLS